MAKQTKFQARHGDLLIERIAAPTPGGTKRAGQTLAQGEQTGHHHTIVGAPAELFDTDRGLEFRVEPGAVVTHQEHGPVVLDAGWYRLTVQREWSDAEEPIQVQD